MEEKYLQMNINYTVRHNKVRKPQVTLCQKNEITVCYAMMLEYQNNKMLPIQAIYKILAHPIYICNGIYLEMESIVSSRIY